MCSYEKIIIIIILVNLIKIWILKLLQIIITILN